MFSSMSTALIPYTPPKTGMEFVHSEVKRSLTNAKITHEQFVLNYGSYGLETARKISDALQSHSLSIIYNAKIDKFTVLGSCNLNKETIKEIFAKNSYRVWKPKVLEEVDSYGNRMIKFCQRFDRSELWVNMICGRSVIGYKNQLEEENDGLKDQLEEWLGDESWESVKNSCA